MTSGAETTPQEIRDMSAAVARHFGWWEPGQTCETCPDEWPKHEFPPPDLTQPEWFVRLLKVVRPHNLFFDHDMGHWECVIPGEERTADTPELALLKAAFVLTQKETN